jgi:hypothetical protein
MSLLCEEQICLLGRREVRYAISGVEHNWPLFFRQAGVLAKLNGLVVAEMTVEY